MKESGKWPYAVCRKGADSNSILYSEVSVEAGYIIYAVLSKTICRIMSTLDVLHVYMHTWLQ